MQVEINYSYIHYLAFSGKGNQPNGSFICSFSGNTSCQARPKASNQTYSYIILSCIGTCEERVWLLSFRYSSKVSLSLLHVASNY